MHLIIMLINRHDTSYGGRGGGLGVISIQVKFYSRFFFKLFLYFKAM